jgi:hypothetical protein
LSSCRGARSSRALSLGSIATDASPSKVPLLGYSLPASSYSCDVSAGCSHPRL